MFGLAAGTSFMLYLHRYTWVMVRPELKAEFGFSEQELGGLYTLFNVTYALGQIPGGIVCDRSLEGGPAIKAKERTDCLNCVS